jgi:hypothetical protein
VTGARDKLGTGAGKRNATVIRRPAGQPQERPGTFTFLGFTHFWGKSRKGHDVVKQQTAANRGLSSPSSCSSSSRASRPRSCSAGTCGGTLNWSRWLATLRGQGIQTPNPDLHARHQHPPIRKALAPCEHAGRVTGMLPACGSLPTQVRGPRTAALLEEIGRWCGAASAQDDIAILAAEVSAAAGRGEPGVANQTGECL